jgi:tetratricopeptide (TPR) repeat protein
MGRFLKRHRVPVAATAFGLLVATGLGAQSWQQRQAARLSQTQAQTVDGLLQSLFRGMSPDVAANRSFSAKELLDRGQAFLESRAEVDPATRRAARLRMAELYRDVGAYPDAAKAFKAEADEAGQAADFAGQQRALWQWANVLVKTLDTDAATRAVAELEQVLAAHPERSPGIDARMALLRGELALTRRQSAEAEKSLAQAESRLDSERDLELAARAALGQGMAAKQLGDVVRARAHMDRAQTLQNRRGADAVIDRLAVSLQIGTLENWAGRHAAATAALTQTDLELRARLGASHPFTVAAASELAYAALRQGRFDDVQRHLKNIRGSTGPADAWREDCADLMAALAQLYGGQASAAEPALRRLLKAMERDEGGVTPATEPMRRLHGEALLRLNRVAEAEAVLRETERNQLAFPAPDPFGLAATRLLLGCAWARQGRLDLAGTAWQDAAQVMSREVGAQHPSTLLASSYAALLAPAGPQAQAQRQQLAHRLQQELPWLDGAEALSALLRDGSRPPDWRRLPVAL